MQAFLVLSRQLLGMAFLIWNFQFGRLTVLTVLVEGLELQSFSYHPALFLVAGSVSFLCLPYFSQSELRGGVVIRSRVTRVTREKRPQSRRLTQKVGLLACS
eukprot:1141145-Pelagomonas_calceolata.AAC.1